MPTFVHEGLRLHYVLREGPADGGGPALLIHGLGSSTEDWLLQIEALAERRPVAALDLPGFGESQGFHPWPRIDDYADAARALCVDLWRRPAHIIGLSLGGVVGLHLAASAAEGVESVIAVGTPMGLRLTPRGWLRGAARLAAVWLGRMDWVARLVSRDLFPRDDQRGLRAEGERRLARNDRMNYLRGVVALARTKDAIRVDQIRRPVLFIAGREDRTVPAARQAELARHIPGALFVEIFGSGHATPVDSPEDFNRTVLDFLAGLEPPVIEAGDRHREPAIA